MEAKFSLGRTVITQGAHQALDAASVRSCLSRHASGDWGDACPQDARANERAIIEGTSLFSVYHDAQRRKFWIITEADRSVTTILLPSEY